MLCTMYYILSPYNLYLTIMISRVQRVDGKDENIKGIQLKRMVDRIRRFQVLKESHLPDIVHL